jgi:UDP-glucuronate decarboxylase
MDYYRQHDLRIKIVRIFNTYGPRMLPDDGRVVSNFIVQALKNEDITIYGDGSQTRSFCYVTDLIDGMVRMMNSPDELIGPINLGNPREFTMLELASEIRRLTGSDSKIVHAALPQDDPTRRRPNIDKAKSNLGWEPSIALGQGLVDTIAYFRNVLASA